MLTGLVCLIGTAIFAQAPVAAFTSNVTQGCAPLGVAFKDQSTNSPTSWEWDFGNGSTSSSQNPGCTYSTPGTYTVTLIVKNASGANAVRMTNYITVYPPRLYHSATISARTAWPAYRPIPSSPTIPRRGKALLPPMPGPSAMEPAAVTPPPPIPIPQPATST